MASILLELTTALIRNSIVNLLMHINKRFNATVYIGIAFTLGLSYHVYPKLYGHLPKLANDLVGSSIALALIAAIIGYFILGRR